MPGMNTALPGVAEFRPGEWLGLHRHAPPEVYYVVAGAGLMSLEGREIPATPQVTPSDWVAPLETRVRQRSRPRTGSSQPSCAASFSWSANGLT